MPIVRPATPGDSDAFLELVKKFHAKVKPPYTLETTLGAMGQVGSVWVAEVDGELKGYVWFLPKGPREVFLQQIYAEGDVADAFHRVLVPILRNSGYAVVECVVLRDGWRRILRRWGFRVTGVVMEKVIGSREVKDIPELPD